MRSFVYILLTAFFFSTLNIAPAQGNDVFLPKPGAMVRLSPSAFPPVLKGIKVHPNNPLYFEFILDIGTSTGQEQALKEQSQKLIKYFLAALTIPEKDLWVNLSPYEKDRIVPEGFGQTEMGRDLLAQDYILKQITASIIYPEDEIGKEFWKRVYEESAKKFGNTKVPVNTFNKVWIVPEKAVVYENAKAGTAYVVESNLKVMLEEDYLSRSKHEVGPATGSKILSTKQHPSPSGETNEKLMAPAASDKISDPASPADSSSTLASSIIREIVIPELTKEINHGQNFSQLRQVYNSLILAAWYKRKIKESILSQVYVDKMKIKGLQYPQSQPGDRSAKQPCYQADCQATDQSNVKASEGSSLNDVENIYQRYLEAFKKGAYNFIKEESDPLTGKMIPRKYFSGGANLTDLAMNAALQMTNQVPHGQEDALKVVGVQFDPKRDLAMNANALLDAIKRSMKVQVIDEKARLNDREGIVGGHPYSQHYKYKIGSDVWLFKVPPPNIWHRVILEQFTSKLSQRIGLSTATEAFAGQAGDQFGLFSKWAENRGSLWQKLTRTGIKNLSSDQLKSIVREHALDWLISNHDAHGGHFLIEPNGQLRTIDKGQAYKYFGNADEKLSLSYNPNMYFNGPRIDYVPIYNLVWKGLLEGWFKGWLQDSFTFAQAKEAVLEVITQIESISDEEFLRLGLADYAHVRFDLMGKENNEQFTAESFKVAALERKHHLRRDFENFFKQIDAAMRSDATKKFYIDPFLSESKFNPSPFYKAPYAPRINKTALADLFNTALLSDREKIGISEIRIKPFGIVEQQDLPELYYGQIQRMIGPWFESVRQDVLPTEEMRRSVVDQIFDQVAPDLKGQELYSRIMAEAASGSVQQNFATVFSAFIDQQALSNGHDGFFNIYLPRDAALGYTVEMVLMRLKGQDQNAGLFYLSRDSLGEHYVWISKEVTNLLVKYHNRDQFLDELWEAIEEKAKVDSDFNRVLVDLIGTLKSLGYHEKGKVRIIDSGYQTFPLFLEAVFRGALGVQTAGLVMSSTAAGILPELNKDLWDPKVTSAVDRQWDLSQYVSADITLLENDVAFLTHPFAFNKELKRMQLIMDPQKRINALWIQVSFVMGAIQYYALKEGLIAELESQGISGDDARSMVSIMLNEVLKKPISSDSSYEKSLVDIFKHMDSKNIFEKLGTSTNSTKIYEIRRVLDSINYSSKKILFKPFKEEFKILYSPEILAVDNKIFGKRLSSQLSISNKSFEGLSINQLILKVPAINEKKESKWRFVLAVLFGLKGAILDEDKKLSVAQADVGEQLEKPHDPSFTKIGEDKAMKGGIDLNLEQMNLELRNAGEAMRFQTNEEMILQLKRSQGLEPVILHILPLANLSIFLEG